MGRRLTKHQIIRISLIGAIILGLVIMAFLFYKAFNVTGYEVTGNSHYSDEEIYIGKNLPANDIFNERNLKRYDYLKKLVENSNISIDNIELIKEYEVLKNWKNSLI